MNDGIKLGLVEDIRQGRFVSNIGLDQVVGGMRLMATNIVALDLRRVEVVEVVDHRDGPIAFPK